MRRFRKILTLAMLASSPLAMAKEKKSLSLHDLEQYFNEVTPNWIHPSDQPFGEQVYDFIEDKHKRWKGRFIPAIREIGKFQNDDQPFLLNEQNYIHSLKARDLLGAKLNFYSALKFDWESTQYERPYSYLANWGALHHPPIRQLTRELPFYTDFFKPGFEPDANHPFFDPEFQKAVDRESNTHLTSGNRVNMLINDASFFAKLRLVREAKRYFFSAVLFIQCDERTEELIDEMAKATARGVDVRMLIEGAFMLPEAGCIAKLRRAGVDVLGGTHLIFESKDRYGVMHNKIWIRDGEEAIIGGQNLIEADNAGTGFNHLNRDTDVLMRGPVVTDLLGSYIELWDRYDDRTLYKQLLTEHREIATFKREWLDKLVQEANDGLRGQKHYADLLTDPSRRMNGVCRMAVQGPAADGQPIGPIIHKYLEASRMSFFLESPVIEYEPLDEREKGTEDSWHYRLVDLSIAKKASDPMFEVHMLSNGFDGGNGELSASLRRWVDWAREKHIGWLENFLYGYLYNYNRKFIGPRMERLATITTRSDVNVWTYFQFTHSKIYYFDRTMVSVGSWNMDLYSSIRSQEVQLFCMDQTLREETERMLTLDLVNSVPVPRALPQAKKKKGRHPEKEAPAHHANLKD